MKRISNAILISFSDLGSPLTAHIQPTHEYMIYASCILMDLFWEQSSLTTKTRMFSSIGVVVFIMLRDKRPVVSVT